MRSFAIWSMFSVTSLAHVGELEESDEVALLSLYQTHKPKWHTPKNRPKTCHCKQQKHEPVCGSDGKQYDNECEAKCAGAELEDVKQSRCKKAKRDNTLKCNWKWHKYLCKQTCATCHPETRTGKCLAKDASIVVIGGGPSGIHMASELKQRGFTNVVVLEKNVAENRFGKCQSFKMEDTGDVPHELGTCYLASSYRDVRRLLVKYVGSDASIIPGGEKYGNLMLPSPQMLSSFGYPGNADLFDKQWLALNTNRLRNWTTLHNASTYEMIMARECLGYIELHNEIFEAHPPHGLPPKPEADKMKLIDKSFYDFMTENGFPNLLDYTAIGLGSYGFGFDIPALYGLMMINPVAVFQIIDQDPNKIPTVEVVRDGFSNLWNQIVIQDEIDLRRGHAVSKIRPKKEGFEVVAQVIDSDASETRSFHADELIFATPVNQFVAQTILEKPSSLEQQIAGELQHVGLNVGLYKSKKKVLHVLPPDQTGLQNFPDQALEFYPEPLQRAFTRKPSGEVYAERNDVLTYHAELDGDLENRYVMAYQHFTSGDFKETEANAKAKNFVEGEVDGSTEFVVGRSYKEYLPHFGNAAIQEGVPWKILESQGVDHKWYIGSFVVFESAEDVVAYNKQVLAQASSIFCD